MKRPRWRGGLRIGSKLLTIAAGVLGAVFLYAMLARFAAAHGAGSTTAIYLVSGNIGAVVAALLVALSPADQRHAIYEAITTWALATIVLMFMVAPHIAAAHHAAALLQASG